MKNQHIDEVISALEELSISYKISTKEEGASIFNKILISFGKYSFYKYPLWENLADWYAVDFRFSWEWFDQIIESDDLILFFEPADDRNFILLNTLLQF